MLQPARSPQRIALALLAALVAVLLASGCGQDADTSTTQTTIATPTGTLTRIELERGGGIAPSPTPERVVVTEPADLARLAALLPDPLPAKPTGPQGGCDDCRSYDLTIVTSTGTTKAAFDENAIPPGYEALIAELTGRL